jgi:hypothetical protein
MSKLAGLAAAVKSLLPATGARMENRMLNAER